MIDKSEDTIKQWRDMYVFSLRFPVSVFTTRRYVSALYAVVMCPSVRLSVCHTSSLYCLCVVRRQCEPVCV